MAVLGLVADDDDDGNAASRPKVQSKPEHKQEPRAEVASLTHQLRDALTAKYGEPIKGKPFVEKVLGREIGKLSELGDAEIAGVLLELA